MGRCRTFGRFKGIGNWGSPGRGNRATAERRCISSTGLFKAMLLGRTPSVLPPACIVKSAYVVASGARHYILKIDMS